MYSVASARSAEANFSLGYHQNILVHNIHVHTQHVHNIHGHNQPLSYLQIQDFVAESEHG